MILEVLATAIIGIIMIAAFMLSGMSFEAEEDNVSIVMFAVAIILFGIYTALLL